MTVRGKGNRLDGLPLPVDVGEAMADYLQHGRPRTPARSHLFVCAVARPRHLRAGLVRPHRRPWAHQPSGSFAANAAWTVLAAIAHNLLRAAGTITGTAKYAVACGATLRRDLVNVPARLARPQRRPVLHLPARWPRAKPWQGLWTAASLLDPGQPHGTNTRPAPRPAPNPTTKTEKAGTDRASRPDAPSIRPDHRESKITDASFGSTNSGLDLLGRDLGR
jgi:hypothetical protein